MTYIKVETYVYQYAIELIHINIFIKQPNLGHGIMMSKFNVL